MADPISDALKNAVVAAADTHLANVTADVNRLKAAVQADLPSVAATAVSVEAIVKAEIAKIKLDIVSLMPSWMKVVVIGGAGIAAGAGVYFLHWL